MSVHVVRIREYAKTRRMVVGKQKSDIPSGMGIDVEILEALRSAGVNDDDLRAIFAEGSVLSEKIVAFFQNGVSHHIKTKANSDLVSDDGWDGWSLADRRRWWAGGDDRHKTKADIYLFGDDAYTLARRRRW